MTKEGKEGTAYLPVSRELHPVGARLLVMLVRTWLVEGGEPELDEVTVAEWSPGGLVKLRFVSSEAEDGYGSWHRPATVEVVEQLEPVTVLRYDVKGGYRCRP